MIPLTITLDIEQAPWTDLKPELQRDGLGTVTRVGRLPRGMESGRATVSIAIEMADGRKVVGQTSMALFLAAAAALKAREEEMSGSNVRN